MEITSVMFLINTKRAAIEEKLKNDERIEEFDIEDLDKQDMRKDVMLVFKTPINHRYVGDVLSSLVKNIEESTINVE